MRVPAPLAAALAATLLAAAPAAAQFSVNVLQDCWTNNPGVDIETEAYDYPGGAPVRFVWKHKIMNPCTNYVVRIIGQPCRNGKPKPVGPAPFEFRRQFGPIVPNPDVPELLFEMTAPAGAVPGGTWDWFMFTECDDTTGGIPLAPDGDIDDECGINVGRPPIVPFGPVVFGPEPTEVLDATPGGAPPGRSPGEEGTTRPWCLTVE